MTVLQISSPGSHERADGSLTRAVDAEGGGTLTLATEPLRMMEPPSFRSGKAFCTVNSVPLTLMLNSFCRNALR